MRFFWDLLAMLITFIFPHSENEKAESLLSENVRTLLPTPRVVSFIVYNENAWAFTYLPRFPNCTVLLPQSPFLCYGLRSTPIDWLRQPRDPPCNIQLKTSFFQLKDSFILSAANKNKQYIYERTVTIAISHCNGIYFSSQEQIAYFLTQEAVYFFVHFKFLRV